MPLSVAEVRKEKVKVGSIYDDVFVHPVWQHDNVVVPPSFAVRRGRDPRVASSPMKRGVAAFLFDDAKRLSSVTKRWKG